MFSTLLYRYMRRNQSSQVLQFLYHYPEYLPYVKFDGNYIKYQGYEVKISATHKLFIHLVNKG